MAHQHQIPVLVGAPGAPWLRTALLNERASDSVHTTLDWMDAKGLVDATELHLAWREGRSVAVSPETVGLFSVSVAAVALAGSAQVVTEQAVLDLALSALNGVRSENYEIPVREWIEAIQAHGRNSVLYDHFRRMLAAFVARQSSLVSVSTEAKH